MIDEATVFPPVLHIIKRNAPSEAEQQELFQGKTIFFERAFFRIIGCIGQTSIRNSNSHTFYRDLPRSVRVPRHPSGLTIRSEDWQLICEQTGFATAAARDYWRQLLLSFVHHKMALIDYIPLESPRMLSPFQTNFFLLFCYFYHHNEDYTKLHRTKDLNTLPEKRHITWSLFDPGVFSRFIAPLRKIKSISDFDERELADLLRLSGNSLTSLRWVLHPLYTEWFLPIRRQLLQLHSRNQAPEAQPIDRPLTSEPVAAKPAPEPPVAEPVILFSMPQITPEEYRGLGDHGSRWSPPLQEAAPAALQHNQGWGVGPSEGDTIPEIRFIAVFEEFLRTPGDFEQLFSSVLPNSRESKRRASWRLVERTLLSLRSLFIQGGFHTFGEIDDTVCMSAVKWPYALDDRFALSRPAAYSDTWRITRRGVMRGDTVVFPILVVPHEDVRLNQL